MKARGRNLDRISCLHESVRQNIIYFLPMEDAIRTSVLSKNWRFVCSSLPNLEFDDWEYSEKACKNPGLGNFRDMIDQTLILHDQSDIHTFSLRKVLSLSPISTQHINSWISFAIRHNVQHIRVQHIRKIIERIPMCLFTCNTLRVLHLDNCHLHLPPTIVFPFLKSLSFYRVKFVDKNLTNRLLSSCSCPVLEELKVTSCFQDHANMHTVSFTRLKYLNLITDCEDKNLKLKISIPHLHKFEYEGNEPPNLSPATISSIACASFMINPFPDVEYRDCFTNYARTILLGISNVEELTLWDDFLEFLMRDQDFLNCLTPLCRSLKVLHLYMSCANNQVDATTLLLRKFPNLQILRLWFYEGDCNSSNILEMKDYSQCSKASDQDVLKHLKQVEIELLQGSEDGLDLVRYILGTAYSLEKMNIKFIEDVRDQLQDRMTLCQKLLTFTRVSPTAAIFFMLM